jgi:excisionase family DNA binding protein
MSEPSRKLLAPPRLADRLALRPAEATKALGISEKTLRKWMRERELPYARLDGVVLIPRGSLERWIEEHLTTDSETNRLVDEILAEL